MPPPAKKPPEERAQTDASLREEREKADHELIKASERIAEDADAVVEQARQRADETLVSARLKADLKLAQSGARAESVAAVRAGYAKENEVIAAERDVADATLSDEREERRRALVAMLHTERGETDHHLLLERARSDFGLTKRDDFLGLVSHDLRTILGGIALSASRLIKTAPNDDAGKQSLKVAQGIQRYAGRMNRLIGDLLDVSSIESGRLSVRPEPLDVVKLINDAMEIFQPLATERTLVLEAEIGQAPLIAIFDHDRILQVLGNLLSNALKFTPAGGRIRVQAEAVGAEVRLTVSDSGSGIPSDKWGAVFERFWQVAANDSRGLGLGLFITKCIVEAHKGRIWVERSNEKGSTFCFTLPRSEPTA